MAFQQCTRRDVHALIVASVLALIGAGRSRDRCGTALGGGGRRWSRSGGSRHATGLVDWFAVQVAPEGYVRKVLDLCGSGIGKGEEMAVGSMGIWSTAAGVRATGCAGAASVLEPVFASPVAE